MEFQKFSGGETPGPPDIGGIPPKPPYRLALYALAMAVVLLLSQIRPPLDENPRSAPVLDNLFAMCN